MISINISLDFNKFFKKFHQIDVHPKLMPNEFVTIILITFDFLLKKYKVISYPFIYKHFRITICAPASLYSLRDTSISLKADVKDKMDPPFQT